MAKQAQEGAGRDITDEVMDHTITKAEEKGKQPLIPEGIYNDCTVNVLDVKEFQDDDGQPVRKARIKFTSPHTDADLTARMKVSFHTKASFGKLARAVGLKEGDKLRILNGKRVNMVVSAATFNGNDYNEFTFLPVGAAASAKK